MRKLIIIVSFFVAANAFSQQVDPVKKAQEIAEEGKYLYRLEMAAWHGTDIFPESFTEKSRIGGYFTYIEKDTPKCLFFSKGDNPKVIGVVSFGDIKVVETATIDFKERDFKRDEKELYTMRTTALQQIQQDTLFRKYTNTNFNLIPVVYKEERKVYVLTAPKKEGVVLFGNDYQ
ncbi:MAG: hypothetical protein LBL79_11630, partial [Prevotella sp.]|nr:hypothetical protein [Prevotella sp.]